MCVSEQFQVTWHSGEMAGLLLSLLGELVGVIRWVVDQASDILFPLYWGKVPPNF